MTLNAMQRELRHEYHEGVVRAAATAAYKCSGSYVESLDVMADAFSAYEIRNQEREFIRENAS